VGILSWIVVGLIAGVVAKLLLPGRDPGGCIITMLIGIAGAILGGFLVGLFVGVQCVHGGLRLGVRRHLDEGEAAGPAGLAIGHDLDLVNLTTVLVAVLGAIILLLLYRLLLGRRASAP